ncbi:hypothetical protein [Parabacteroides sp.]
METHVPTETLLEQIGEAMHLDTKELADSFPEFQALLEKAPEEERADYLRRRVKQLLEQNECQNEQIYKQDKRIAILEDAVKKLSEALVRLRQETALKDGEVEDLRKEVDLLKADFDLWRQTERHSLAECISMLEEYPASQNEEVRKLAFFLLKMFRTASSPDRDRLNHLGTKDPAPMVQFNKPLCDVNGNGTVNIGKTE